MMATLGAAPACAQYGGPPPDEEWHEPDDYGPPPGYELANPPAAPGGGWRNGVWSPTHRCWLNGVPTWCWSH